MKKEHEPTLAQRVLNGKDLMIERPIGMDFEAYRMMRKIQTNMLRKLRK